MNIKEFYTHFFVIFVHSQRHTLKSSIWIQFLDGYIFLSCVSKWFTRTWIIFICEILLYFTTAFKVVVNLKLIYYKKIYSFFKLLSTYMFVCFYTKVTWNHSRFQMYGKQQHKSVSNLVIYFKKYSLGNSCHTFLTQTHKFVF